MNVCVYVCAAYTMAKYGMSMCVLGMAEELRSDGIAVNALWPRTGTYAFGNPNLRSFVIITLESFLPKKVG